MSRLRKLTRVSPIVLRDGLASLASFVLVSVPFLLWPSPSQESLPIVQIDDQPRVLEGGQDGLFWVSHAPNTGRVSINIPDSNWIIFVTRHCPNLGAKFGSPMAFPLPAQDRLLGRRYDTATSPLRNSRSNLSFNTEDQILKCPEGSDYENATTVIFLSNSQAASSTALLKSAERVEGDGASAWIWSTTTKLSATFLLRASPLQYVLEVEAPPCSPSSAVPRISIDAPNGTDSSFSSDNRFELERTLAPRHVHVNLELAEASACTLEGDGRQVYFLFRARPIGEFEQLKSVLHSSST